MRAYYWLIHACAVISALVLGLVAVLVTFDVIARNIGLGSFPWIVDASEYSLSLITFLIAPWLLYKNDHVRLDVLVTSLPEFVARWVNRTSDLLGLAICAIFVGYGTKTMLDSAAQGNMSVKNMVIPEWWLYVPLPICFLLLALEFVRRMWCSGIVGDRQRQV